jgi:hypothetical protein
VRRRAAPLLLLLLAGCGEEPAPRPLLPPADEFRAEVLAVLATYPMDGTHGYWWPKEGEWKGTTRTLRYEGETIAEGDPEGRCHCCGLTFEVFFRAWETWCRKEGLPFRILDLDAEGVRRLQAKWFGSPEDPTCSRGAILEFGLGREVPPEEALPGDFVQFWRRNGTGHSAVFLGWVREEGRPVALRYWSTQSSTSGISPREEPLSSLDRLWCTEPGSNAPELSASGGSEAEAGQGVEGP